MSARRSTRRGSRPASVGWIVSSHLHFDHYGQNRSFPGVPIVAQRAEREAARASGYTILEWVDFPGAAYELIEGDAELAPGIRIIATPGHTAGHQSMSIETAEGIAVLAGQAVFSAAEWRGTAPPAESSPEARDSVERLRALRPARVLFSHDDEAWP